MQELEKTMRLRGYLPKEGEPDDNDKFYEAFSAEDRKVIAKVSGELRGLCSS